MATNRSQQRKPRERRSAMRIHRVPEHRWRNELQPLADDAGYSIHGDPLGWGDSFLPELILTLAEERLFHGRAEDGQSEVGRE